MRLFVFICRCGRGCRIKDARFFELRRPGERTPLACGFRRPAENFVPQILSLGRGVTPTKAWASRPRRHAGRVRSHFLCGDRTHFGAPFLDCGLDGVMEFAGPGQLFLPRNLKTGWRGKPPQYNRVPTPGKSGHDSALVASHTVITWARRAPDIRKSVTLLVLLLEIMVVSLCHSRT
jgi:hypothetical protein